MSTTRHSAPLTTLAAHSGSKSLAGTLREEVYQLILASGARGMIGDVVLDHFSGRVLKNGSINTRFSELEREGLIVRDGDTRPGKSGHQQLVMRAAEFASTAPRVSGRKLKRSGFLAGLMFAGKIAAESPDILVLKKRLREELIKAAKVAGR